jgi:hypothetical protein
VILENDADAARGIPTKSDHRFAESVAVSSTEPLDFPISALAGFLVRPIGSASVYSRAVLGAIGNLRGRQERCKGLQIENVRILRILNNQHLHSELCNLWITLQWRRKAAPATIQSGATVRRRGPSVSLAGA